MVNLSGWRTMRLMGVKIRYSWFSFKMQACPAKAIFMGSVTVSLVASFKGIFLEEFAGQFD